MNETGFYIRCTNTYWVIFMLKKKFWFFINFDILDYVIFIQIISNKKCNIINLMLTILENLI